MLVMMLSIKSSFSACVRNGSHLMILCINEVLVFKESYSAWKRERGMVRNREKVPLRWILILLLCISSFVLGMLFSNRHLSLSKRWFFFLSMNFQIKFTSSKHGHCSFVPLYVWRPKTRFFLVFFWWVMHYYMF